MAAVTKSDIENFLRLPRSLVGKRFDYSGIPSELEERGKWKVTGYMVLEEEDPIFHVLFEDISKDSWPFGEDDVRKYLKDSTYSS